MSDVGSLASHSSQHVSRCSWGMLQHKRSCHGCFIRPYLHLIIQLLRDLCCADRGSLPRSVRQWWGQLKHLHQRSMSSVGRNWQVVVLKRVYQMMPYLPLNQLIFLFIYLGVSWPGLAYISI